MGTGRTIYFQTARQIFRAVVIDASGAIAGWEKMKKSLETGRFWNRPVFAVVKGIEIDTNIVHIYVGKNIAPAGYAWCFRGEKNTANIGILIGKTISRKSQYRDAIGRFFVRPFSKRESSARFAGSIPCQSGRRAMAVGGFSGRGRGKHDKPYFQGRNFQAMISGGLAGDFALKMLGSQTSRDVKTLCSDYEKRGMKACGRHIANLPASDFFTKVRTRIMKMLRKRCLRSPNAKLTMSTIF